VTFEKMSKSKGNGVSPDAMASAYGVDTLRLGLMFGAPPESDVNFDENFLSSMKQFLDKISKAVERPIKIKQGRKVEQIQQDHRDKLIPVYELLVDYETKIH
jgi:leucyl-tRNA synthetase